MIKLSIIICTYNRADILTYCLNSISKQNISQDYFELIVVDNNSTDSTQDVCNLFSKKFKNFKYIEEKQIGLSYARNTGYLNAKADWVAYIDDDAKLRLNYISEAINTIQNYTFDVIGGKYLAWYLFGKKKWLNDKFGVFKDLRSSIGFVKKGYVAGGNMIIRKVILETLNGFDTDLGMAGNKIGYGEETFFQDKLRKQGFVIWYNPNLIIDHLVGKHKLKLSWHLKSAYAFGRDNYKMWGDREITQFYIVKTIWKSLLQFPKYISKVIADKNYYWQNAYLDILKPIWQSFGEYNGYRNTKNTKK